MDYGTISVTFHPGLTDDQKISIIQMSLNNQLMTNDRMHYNEILNQCIHMTTSDVLKEYPFSIDWNIAGKYKYKFIVQFYDVPDVLL